MILSQRHMELNGKAIISHFIFNPPLVASSDLENEACFIFPINTEGLIYRANEKAEVKSTEGVLMKCGTYVNKWHCNDASEVAEVVILRLFPEVIETVLDSRLVYKASKTKAQKATAVVKLDTLLQKFLEGILFYFDNPQLVNDELVALKIKELTLLLINSRGSSPIIELISNLFSKEKYTLKTIVDAHIFENLTLSELASLSHMSTSKFKRKFKELIGESPGQYIKRTRLNKAKILLADTTKAIAHIAYDCGFNDANYFSKAFHRTFHMSPSAFRKRLSNDLTF